MSINIKDIRRKTGMTQREFAEAYGIPVSTLRKWEQGEASPPQYVLRLIAYVSAVDDGNYQKIVGRHGELFAYDKSRNFIKDTKGNLIYIHEDLSGVNESNLSLYVSELFTEFYAIQDKFDRDCRFDKVEGIQWL